MSEIPGVKGWIPRLITNRNLSHSIAQHGHRRVGVVFRVLGVQRVAQDDGRAGDSTGFHPNSLS